MRIVHVSIKGRVQGVGFRAWMQAEARRQGVTGWVRNCRDGSVEALCEGAADAIEALVAACRRGPGPAGVDKVEVEPAVADALCGSVDFHLRPDA